MSIESINQKLAAAQQHQAGYVKQKIRAKKNAGGSRAQVQRGSSNHAPAVKIPKVIKALLETIQSDDIDSVARVWREAMGATTAIYDLPKKKWIERPDHNTRLKAANMVAAYAEGLPVQRQIQLNANLETLAETLESVKSSPETIRALEAVGFHKRGSEKPVSDAREVGPFD
jgi:hypothetical protein